MVREQRLIIWTVIILVVTGIICIAVRIQTLHKSCLPRGERVWRLTYDIVLPTLEGGKAYIAIPDNTPQSRIFRETFSHQGIWMDILRTKRTLGREAIIVPLVGSEQGRLVAQFDIRVKTDGQLEVAKPRIKLTTQEIAHYLRQERSIQLNNQNVSNIINKLKTGQTTKSELLDRIFDYCSENIVQAKEDGPSDAAETLQQRQGTTLGRARAMVAFCRAAKIPARLVTGFSLQSNLDARQLYWVEVFSGKNWSPYDPENVYAGQLPGTYLPIRRDGIELVRMLNTPAYMARYSIRQLFPPPALVALPENRLWSIVDLTRLPPGMQAIVTLILLLPLAALITAIFRNIIGLRTFGTFTPSLIALSFSHADWRTGAVVFFVVFAIGVVGRLLLNKLKLLMVTRLSVILTMVVLCMILAVSILDYLGLTPSANAVLLPMVILTMMIERFNITAEEDGHPEAFKMLANTLVVAICCLFVLRIKVVGRLMLIFPEVQLLNAAALLLIGRYSGYRLTELWRFRDIAQVRT